MKGKGLKGARGRRGGARGQSAGERGGKEEDHGGFECRQLILDRVTAIFRRRKGLLQAYRSAGLRGDTGRHIEMAGISGKGEYYRSTGTIGLGAAYTLHAAGRSHAPLPFMPPTFNAAAARETSLDQKFFT